MMMWVVPLVNSVNSGKGEQMVEKFIRDNIRKTFKFASKKFSDDLSNIDVVELSAWLNHQECRKLLELRNGLFDLAKEHEDVGVHRNLWNLLYSISWRMWEYKPSDWKINANQEWLKKALNEFKHSWLNCSPNSRLTYYAHIVCDHLLAIIIFLAKINLTIIDVMSQGLENAHCVSNRLLKWNGPGYFVLHNKKRCLMSFSNNKQEMLRWWCTLLRKLYPMNIHPLHYVVTN